MVVSCCVPIVDPPEWFPTATEVWVAVVARVGGVPAKQLGGACRVDWVPGGADLIWLCNRTSCAG